MTSFPLSLLRLIRPRRLLPSTGCNHRKASPKKKAARCREEKAIESKIKILSIFIMPSDSKPRQVTLICDLFAPPKPCGPNYYPVALLKNHSLFFFFSLWPSFLERMQEWDDLTSAMRHRSNGHSNQGKKSGNSKVRFYG